MLSDHPENHSEEADIQLDQNEWTYADAPLIVETTGLGPCIGIIIYDNTKKGAFVGHFTYPLYEPQEFNEMLSAAKKRFKSISSVKVYVGGGSAVDPDDAQELKHDKENHAFVKKELLALGFRDDQLEITYQNSNQSTILGINTSTGEVYYNTEDHDY